MTTALHALKNRVIQLESHLVGVTRDRDLHQTAVDTNQRKIDDIVAEMNSINAAIELLDAAEDYAAGYQ